MNNSYYQNPMFPGSQMPSGTPNQQTAPSLEQTITGISPTATLTEQSYIENILRMNRGKRVRVYMSFTDSIEWRDKVFTGVIEGAGRDHIIISDPETGVWYLLKMIYLDYVDFEEPIVFSPLFTQTR